MINQILLGDSFVLLKEINSKSINLIFTDPPYLKSLKSLYKDWEIEDFDLLANQFDRILKDTGQIAIFGDYLTQTAIANAFQNYFSFRFHWIWLKSCGQPVNKHQPISNVEIISVWKKKNTKTRDVIYNPIPLEKGKPYHKKFSYNNPTRKGEVKEYTTENKTGERYPTQILRFPSKCNLPRSERTKHPTQKPLALCRYVIKCLSAEGDLILDPFSGSGSIPISAYLENRNFIAIEKDPNWWQESIDRLELYQKQTTLFKGV